MLRLARESYLIHTEQPGHSFTSTYPKKLECIRNTRSEKQLLVRPFKARDEDLLRDFFHKLSDIDYSKDMALVALSPPETANHQIIGMGQWIMDDSDGIPEIAFQVRDDWQGEGLGSFFVHRLFKPGTICGIKKFKADVFSNNEAMNKVFENANVPYKRTNEFGVFHYIFDISNFKDLDLSC